MKNIIMTIGLAAMVTTSAMGMTSDDLRVRNLDVQRPTEQTLRVVMDLVPRDFNIKYNQDVRITPVIRQQNGNIEKKLPSVTFAGRNAYYYDLRDSDVRNLYKRNSKQTVNYSEDVAYEPWMEHSTLDFECVTGCCGNEQTSMVPMAVMDYAKPVFSPEMTYIQPAAVSSKLFNLEGQAFINFPVNKTQIFPDYMTNPEELKKILDTIDAVRDNKDAKVKKISLCGYASPEGPYANNVRLAEGRTVALREYVRKQYEFPENLFSVSSVPEDWKGLREAVAKSELADKDQIIEFIDSDYPIEKRNDRLRQLFPDTYPYLLKYVYPGLRHTDYVVNYEVRKYTDIDEIRRVLKTRPQNLSLNEFFLAAQSYEPGTKEYNEVFDVAVRMYPKDPVANINAAMSAIDRGDLVGAQAFLDRVQGNPQADYARGILAAKKGDYQNALSILDRVNTPQARNAIDQINKILNYKGAVDFNVGK